MGFTGAEADRRAMRLHVTLHLNCSYSRTGATVGHLMSRTFAPHLAPSVNVPCVLKSPSHSLAIFGSCLTLFPFSFRFRLQAAFSCVPAVSKSVPNWLKGKTSSALGSDASTQLVHVFLFRFFFFDWYVFEGFEVIFSHANERTLGIPALADYFGPD